MMNRAIILLIFYPISLIVFGDSIDWNTDILGDNFESRHIKLNDSYDGKAYSTIIRKKTQKKSSRAVLYIHGFNDYFFQKEMGNRFTDSVFNFYAIDLRRHGRSWNNSQHPCDIRNVEDYFEEIDSAVNIILADGCSDITLIGHSTGGLTVSLYAALHNDRHHINRIILNSPFLEWNKNSFYRNFLIPLVGFWSNFSKDTKINQGNCDGYSQSLLKDYHGEWEYNCEWKRPISPEVTSGWIKAIDSAQSKLMKNAHKIDIPILIMYSDKKIDNCSWSPEFQYADAVLDPEMIRKKSEKLGKKPLLICIENGMHDLILSSYPARESVYSIIFDFISKN